MTLQEMFEDRSSFASVLIKLKTRQLLGHPAYQQADRDDLTQVLAMAVVRHLARYDPERASLNTFLARIIESRAASLVRAAERTKRDHRRNAYSLNQSTRDASGRRVQRGDLLDDSHRARHTDREPENTAASRDTALDVQEAIAGLPPQLRVIAELLMHSSEHAAAQTLRISRRQMAKHVAQLREIFESRKLRDYLPKSGQQKK